MKNSVFLLTVCIVISICISFAKAEDKQKNIYTLISDQVLELYEIHLVDVDNVKYSVFVNKDFGLSKVMISRKKELVEVSGKCFQKIYFPNLQTLTVSRAPIKSDWKHTLIIFDMEFNYFGGKEAALTESVALQDWSLRLLIAPDSTAKLKVESEDRKLSIDCEVTTKRG